MSKPIVVDARHDVSRGRGVTYQLELVLCGKKGCRKRHGPYWYAYWTSGNRTRKRYIGKQWRSLDDAEASPASPATAARARGPRRRAVLGNGAGAGESLPKVAAAGAGGRSRRRRR